MIEDKDLIALRLAAFASEVLRDAGVPQLIQPNAYPVRTATDDICAMLTKAAEDGRQEATAEVDALKRLLAERTEAAG